MKKMFVGLLFLLLSTAALAALPTVQQVEAAARAGRYTQAESMMSEVVAAKPESARAHYIYAELLARNGNLAKASEEAAKARQIDPKLAFTEPERFTAFEQSLQRAQAPAETPRSRTTAPVAPAYAPAAAAAPAMASSGNTGIPGWVWFVGLIVLAIVLWRGFARSRAASAGSAGSPGAMATTGGPNNPYPYPNAGVSPGAQGYAPNGVPQGRAGSGLLGTGLAVAGGVAGGMLIDQMLHRGHDGGSANNAAGAGNLEPGAFGLSSPGSGSNPLADQPIDYGQGGDNWDSGGGSVDLGGGSDGGGGWD